MQQNFDPIIKKLLAHEGGYVNHPKDPGGATNLGITIAVYSAHLGKKATIAQMKALTKAVAIQIYKSQYWDKVQGDELPSGVDYAVFDYAVNSGPYRAAIALQRALDVADDGVIGPLTIVAARRMDAKLLIDRLCAERLSFMMRLSTWKVFGKGWKKRVNQVEATATKMVTT